MKETSYRLWLRLEGAAVLGISVLLYAQFGIGWGWFALLLFTPDVFMLGYLRDAKAGALIYNVGHSYLTASVLAALGLIQVPLLLALSLIWFAHIGLDRMLGYGLKLPTGFKHTHLSAHITS